MPAVSIITTIFNAAPFLGEAIESVLAQRGAADWELLLVDDGSTDESARIASDYCARDPRLQLVTHPGGENRGISASRNAGLRRVRAPLVAFLDADDVWLPGKLRFQMDILAAHPEVAMTFGAAERWYSWDPAETHAEDFVVPAMVPGIGTDTLVAPPELLRAYLQDESLTPCTCTVLVRREAVDRVGGFEESFPGLYDDQVFYAKLCSKESVFVTSECLARYRQHDSSCCATARRLRTEQRGRDIFLHWLRAYYPQSAAWC